MFICQDCQELTCECESKCAKCGCGNCQCNSGYAEIKAVEVNGQLIPLRTSIKL